MWIEISIGIIAMIIIVAIVLVVIHIIKTHNQGPVLCLYEPNGCDYENQCMVYVNSCTSDRRCIKDVSCQTSGKYAWPQNITGYLSNSANPNQLIGININGNLIGVNTTQEAIPMFMSGTNVMTKILANKFAYWSNDSGNVVFDNDPSFPIMNLYYNTQTGQIVDNLSSPTKMIVMGTIATIESYSSPTQNSVWIFKPLSSSL